MVNDIYYIQLKICTLYYSHINAILLTNISLTSSANIRYAQLATLLTSAALTLTRHALNSPALTRHALNSPSSLDMP